MFMRFGCTKAKVRDFLHGRSQNVNFNITFTQHKKLTIGIIQKIRSTFRNTGLDKISRITSSNSYFIPVVSASTKKSVLTGDFIKESESSLQKYSNRFTNEFSNMLFHQNLSFLIILFPHNQHC